MLSLDVLLLPPLNSGWSLELNAAEGTKIYWSVNPDPAHLTVTLFAAVADGEHKDALGLAYKVEHPLVTCGERLVKSVAAGLSEKQRRQIAR